MIVDLEWIKGKVSPRQVLIITYIKIVAFFSRTPFTSLHFIRLYIKLNVNVHISHVHCFIVFVFSHLHLCYKSIHCTFHILKKKQDLMIRPRVDPCLFWNLKLLPSSNYCSETTTRLALVSLNTRRHLSLGNSELRLVQSKIYSQMRGVFQSQNTIQNETTSRVGTISESLYPD